MHDLSKLHPIHKKAYEEFQKSEYTPDVPDALYEMYVELNKKIPDIIGVQEKDMTKEQKQRYEEMKQKFDKPVAAPMTNNPNAVKEFEGEHENPSNTNA